MVLVAVCRSVIAMCRPEWLPQSSVAAPAGGEVVTAESAAARRPQDCLALDGNALESLEVLAWLVQIAGGDLASKSELYSMFATKAWRDMM